MDEPLNIYGSNIYTSSTKPDCKRIGIIWQDIRRAA